MKNNTVLKHISDSAATYIKFSGLKMTGVRFDTHDPEDYQITHKSFNDQTQKEDMINYYISRGYVNI